jgi:peroxiredoxin
MKLITILGILMSSIGSIAFGQEKTTLTILFTDGKEHSVKIEKVLGNQYYLDSLPDKAINGKDIIFNTAILNPAYVSFVIDSNFQTNPVVLHPGVNIVQARFFQNKYQLIRRDKYLEENAMGAYNNLFANNYDIYKYLRDHQLGDMQMKDSLLNLSYNNTDTVVSILAKDYPSSYVPLYKIAHLLPFGNRPIFREIYNGLDANLRNSNIARILDLELKKAEQGSVGNEFPQFSLTDRNNVVTDLNTLINNNKFTLIDYWYSNCGPCIAQFPELAELFRAHKGNGFSIVGISVDQDQKKWLKAVEKYQIPWTSLIDSKKNSSDYFGITAYPSNFLVDATGQIIGTNITTESLKKFLKENM